MIDRHALRQRPERHPVMYQSWGSLLFMHWPLDAALLRPMLPRGLEVDTFDDQAWIGLVPFTMWGVRPAFLPAVPGLSRLHELNVRTYVHHEGVPGVWFFSLDATSWLAVRVARRLFHLPYLDAEITLTRDADSTIHYRSARAHRGAPPAIFEADWTPGPPLPPAADDSLDFFLTERYCLYAADGDRLFRGRIHHAPWPLRRATLHHHRSTMIAALGLPEPAAEPLLHHADALHVAVWPLKRIA